MILSSAHGSHHTGKQKQMFDKRVKKIKPKKINPYCERVSPTLSPVTAIITDLNTTLQPRLARGTNSAASDWQRRSTRLPRGWKAQQSVPAGTFLPSTIPSIQIWARPEEIASPTHVFTKMTAHLSVQFLERRRYIQPQKLWTALIFSINSYSLTLQSIL